MPATLANYLAANTFESSAFTWMSAEKMFVACASDLGWASGSIAIRSARTGQYGRFEFDAHERDAEGDVTIFRFKGVGEARGCTVKLFND